MTSALGIEEILYHFEELRDTYQDFGDFLQRHIEGMLRDTPISFFKTEARVKDLASLEENVKRYRIERIDEISDFLGLRIICYYPSDIEKIRSIIKSTFLISDDDDKSRQPNPDQFGYRSHHLTISLASDAKDVPLLKKFANLAAEVQIRTLQMHSWAVLAHTWSYKTKFEIPDDVEKEIAILSVSLEQADRQIEIVAKKRQEYIAGIRKGQLLQELLSLDSLELFLELYVPERRAKIDDTRRLLADMIEWGLLFRDLEKVFTRYAPKMQMIESTIQPRCPYSRAGAFRILLDINDELPVRWKAREELLCRFPDSAEKLQILATLRTELNENI